jgi:hypothetical protein
MDVLRVCVLRFLEIIRHQAGHDHFSITTSNSPTFIILMLYKPANDTAVVIN